MDKECIIGEVLLWSLIIISALFFSTMIINVTYDAIKQHTIIQEYKSMINSDCIKNQQNNHFENKQKDFFSYDIKYYLIIALLTVILIFIFYYAVNN